MRPAALVLAGVFAAAAAPAFAHAFVQAASPEPGSTVAAAPREVRITFSEALEPAFSTITVAGPRGFGGAGPARPAGDTHTLAAPLHAPLPPGRYVVRWRVLATDSHTTTGAFRFELKP
jgi:methionine-rich copper-binding protein CopC